MFLSTTRWLNARWLARAARLAMWAARGCAVCL